MYYRLYVERSVGNRACDLASRLDKHVCTVYVRKLYEKLQYTFIYVHIPSSNFLYRYIVLVYVYESMYVCIFTKRRFDDENEYICAF